MMRTDPSLASSGSAVNHIVGLYLRSAIEDIDSLYVDVSSYGKQIRDGNLVIHACRQRPTGCLGHLWAAQG